MEQHNAPLERRNLWEFVIYKHIAPTEQTETIEYDFLFCTPKGNVIKLSILSGEKVLKQNF
jgi:hypothetical protein